MSGKDIKKDVASAEYPVLGGLISESGMELLYNRTKRIMWSAVEFKELQMVYTCAMREVETKFEVLNNEFNIRHKRNPISSIQTRLKRLDSIVKKLSCHNAAPTAENIEKYVRDMAGIRIICSYIDDIYDIAEALLRQDDVELIERKDYIKNPKPNGYRSLHLIIKTPVFLSKATVKVVVEVQIRTIAMDFWASLEHQLRYKRNLPEQNEISEELRECAESIAMTDEKMMELRKRLELAEDEPTEDEQLLERMKKLDMPIG